MIVIAGCLIVKNNKILMAKEAKKSYYGQWNFPAGYVDGAESITDAAIREVYEETGCKVKLTGVLPISIVDVKGEEPRLMVRFTAEIIEENIKYNTNEILDVQWLDLNRIKNMTERELREYDVSIQFIKDYEENKVYPIEVFNNKKYVRRCRN